MTQVIIQPASGKAARDHYRNTIETPVPLTRIQPHVSPTEFLQLQRHYSEGAAWVWGVTPSNHTKWQRVQPGDIVAFYRDKQLFSASQVTLKLFGRTLATALWRRDESGETWEYVYFLEEPKPIEIPVRAFNRVVGYHPDFFPRGFLVMDQDRSEQLIPLLGPGVQEHRAQE